MKHKIEAARCEADGGRPRPDEVGMPDEVREPAPIYGRRALAHPTWEEPKIATNTPFSSEARS